MWFSNYAPLNVEQQAVSVCHRLRDFLGSGTFDAKTGQIQDEWVTLIEG